MLFLDGNGLRPTFFLLLITVISTADPLVGKEDTYGFRIHATILTPFFPVCEDFVVSMIIAYEIGSGECTLMMQISV